MISGHGDDRFRYIQQVKADFSSNVWFGGTPPELISHLQQKLHLIGKYPEPDAIGLRREIAVLHNVNTEQILAFNGSVEAFYTIALAFREAVSALLIPAFAEYEDACRMHRHIPVFFRKEELSWALNWGVNLCWIGNPNNPDGYIFSIPALEDALRAYPDTVFVIDEAYAAFIPEFRSALSLMQSYSNLIVIHSLTKCCAIPGLRLGYVVTSVELAERLRQFQQPWSVNALAQEAGKFLIEDLKVHMPDAVVIQELSKKLKQLVGQLEDFQVIPSESPFFLVKMQSGTAAELKEFLIQEHNILIRDASNFSGLNEQYFRVCTRSEDDNLLLLEGLKNYSKTIIHRGCWVNAEETETKRIN